MVGGTEKCGDAAIRTLWLYDSGSMAVRGSLNREADGLEPHRDSVVNREG